LAYQPPASSTFLSEQTSHQQSANNTFLAPAISHQPTEQADAPPGRGYRPSAVGKGGAVAGADSRKAWPSVCVSIVISPLFDRALISVPCLLFLNGQHVSLASSSPPSIQYFSPKPHHAVPVLVGHLICVPGIKTSDIGVWMDQTLIIELRVLVKRVQVCQYGS
jgi:hypothetical protein